MLSARHLSELYAGQSSQSGIYSVCFSPNSDYLATAGQDGQIGVSYRYLLTARRDIHAVLRHTATASASSENLCALELDFGYQD